MLMTRLWFKNCQEKWTRKAEQAASSSKLGEEAYALKQAKVMGMFVQSTEQFEPFIQTYYIHVL